MIDTIAFFKNIRPTLEAMSDEDAGILIKALFAHNAGYDPDLSRASDITKAVYPLIEESMDRLNNLREAKSRAGKADREQNGNRTGTEAEHNGNEHTAHNHNHSHIHNQDQDQDHDHDHSSPDGEEKRELKLPKRAPLPPALNTALIEKAWNEYQEMRKAKKKPMTLRAQELTLKELEKLSGGDEQKAVDILNQSIKNAWTGVYALKDGQKKTNWEAV